MQVHHPSNLYDAYLDFSNGASGLKNEIALDYMTTKVANIAKKLFSELPCDLSFEISLAAHRLAKDAYREFEKKLREKYKVPMYEMPLNAYVRNTAGFFLNVLEDKMTQEIKTIIKKMVQVEINRKENQKPKDLSF
ncbi:hypothetical protein [Parachlamydia sp. AcF125]|uniref:hypothetical protein n=1 Tax=Parachlamydia sp. AcF125 TaxID=2795736 RepID=UPI001BC90779|nr:hypothetical protein [Parachlamydia sp. AcF125]MBS4168489.1 hypothetical protein [Parachlamydia sp. AcF125]